MVDLFIASAGYGLLAAEARIRRYAATFASGQADSVSCARGPLLQGERAAWWRGLCALPLPGAQQPRSLTALARQDPSRVILIIASPSYVSAMEEDLLAAKAALRSPGELLIISAPSEPLAPELRGSLLPSCARLQALVGGPRHSLHARVAGLLIDHEAAHHFQPARARALPTRLIAAAPALPVYDRQPRTDMEVQAFIQSLLRCTKTSSATSSLRRLREQGYQCEQQRFKRLFEQATSVAPA